MGMQPFHASKIFISKLAKTWKGTGTHLKMCVFFPSPMGSHQLLHQFSWDITHLQHPVFPSGQLWKITQQNLSGIQLPHRA